MTTSMENTFFMLFLGKESIKIGCLSSFECTETRRLHESLQDKSSSVRKLTVIPLFQLILKSLRFTMGALRFSYRVRTR
jgi:hypothetical protein